MTSLFSDFLESHESNYIENFLNSLENKNYIFVWRWVSYCKVGIYQNNPDDFANVECWDYVIKNLKQ